jgi:hypothetical protein
MKKGIIVLVVIVLLAIWIGSTFIGHRNEMVRKRETVNAAWSQVDVVLQRRSDLIPNLVQTVKGFATHEEKVFGDIAAARAAMAGAKNPQEKIAANGQMDSALSRLWVVITKRCRTTTPTSAYSRTTSSQAFQGSPATTHISRRRRERGRLLRLILAELQLSNRLQHRRNKHTDLRQILQLRPPGMRVCAGILVPVHSLRSALK